MKQGNQPFARNLRHALAIKNWSQGQPAHKAKVSQGHISMILRQERGPSITIALALARALGVSLDWLAGLSKQNPKELEPDEQELLKLYDSLSDDGKAATLDTLRVLIRFMGGTE